MTLYGGEKIEDVIKLCQDKIKSQKQSLKDMKEKESLEAIRQEVIEGLKSGKPMFGKDGVFAPLIQNILNAMLEGEMDAHLTDEERENGNRRNGKMQKQVRTSVGEAKTNQKIRA